MTNFVKCGVLGAFVILAIVGRNAQATDVAANAFLNVNISLNGVKLTNSSIAKIHISNSDVIAAVAVDTTNSFSPKAKLLLKVPVGLQSGPMFVVRDTVNRTNVVDFEVPSTMLWMIQIGDSVDASKTNPTGFITSAQTTIFEFTLQTSQLGFDVQGYTTSTLDNRGNLNQTLADLCPTIASSKVIGTGSDAEGNSTVLQGTITANGRKIVNAN
jgi:hypothetical protein